MTPYPLTRVRCAKKSKQNIAPSPSIRMAAIISTPGARSPSAWAMTMRWLAHCQTVRSRPSLVSATRFRSAPSSRASGWLISAPAAVSTVLSPPARSGLEGRVVGVDMTEEMLGRSRAAAAAMGLRQVEFRQGVIEALPIEDGWADVVMSNGVINLCADKRQVFAEVMRVLKPGGRLQFADIANGKEVPAGALRNIDLWTD